MLDAGTHQSDTLADAMAEHMQARALNPKPCMDAGTHQCDALAGAMAEHWQALPLNPDDFFFQTDFWHAPVERPSPSPWPSIVLVGKRTLADSA